MNELVVFDIDENNDALIIKGNLNVEKVFEEKGADDILEKIRRTALEEAEKLDISTDKNRKAIASLAYKVAKSKTMLDEMGKDLTDEWKKKSAVVDAERKRIRELLDELKKEVRKPLTEWEDAEKLRVDAHEKEITAMQAMVVFSTASPPEPQEIKERINRFSSLKSRQWQEFAKRAELISADVEKSLNDALDAAEKRKAERIELERLRKEEEERKKRDHEERIANEAAEKAKAEAAAEAKRLADIHAERVEAQRQKDEAERLRIIADKEAAEAATRKAEDEKQAAIKKAADDAAKAESDKIAAAEKAAADVKAAEDARIAAEKKSADELKAQAEKAENERLAAAEKARLDQEAAIESERQRVERSRIEEEKATAAREADIAHKKKINNEAVAAIIKVAAFIDAEERAKAIVTAIAKGLIPHVKITY